MFVAQSSKSVEIVEHDLNDDDAEASEEDEQELLSVIGIQRTFHGMLVVCVG